MAQSPLALLLVRRGFINVSAGVVVSSLWFGSRLGWDLHVLDFGLGLSWAWIWLVKGVGLVDVVYWLWRMFFSCEGASFKGVYITRGSLLVCHLDK